MQSISKLFVGIFFILVLLSMSTFTVDQREHGIVFRLGEIVSVKDKPGLYFKTPLIDNMVNHAEACREAVLLKVS
mgnify:CR=1 FL=1